MGVRIGCLAIQFTVSAWLCFFATFFALGREYSIPSPLQRLLAEMVDFFILFFIKATIIISIMHLSGIKWVSLISVSSGGLYALQWWWNNDQAFVFSTLWINIIEVFYFAFQGCFQVCHAFHRGGNRWRHVDGGATENDACCTCISDISVFLWGEHLYKRFLSTNIGKVRQNSGLNLKWQLFHCKFWKGRPHAVEWHILHPSPFRLCAFGEQEEPLRGSFS